jgi:uncharacterized Zn finger protein
LPSTIRRALLAGLMLIRATIATLLLRRRQCIALRPKPRIVVKVAKISAVVNRHDASFETSSVSSPERSLQNDNLSCAMGSQSMIGSVKLVRIKA